MQKEKMTCMHCLSNIGDLIENIEKDIKRIALGILRKLGLSERN